MFEWRRYFVRECSKSVGANRRSRYSIGIPSRSIAKRSPAMIGMRSRFSIGGIGQFQARLNEHGKSDA
jgi:hypothetical protein